MYLLKHSWSRLTRNAWRNRQELIAAGMCTGATCSSSDFSAARATCSPSMA